MVHLPCKALLTRSFSKALLNYQGLSRGGEGFQAGDITRMERSGGFWFVVFCLFFLMKGLNFLFISFPKPSNNFFPLLARL